MKLIEDKAPDAVKYVPLNEFAGKTIACDASLTIY